MKTAVCYSAKT